MYSDVITNNRLATVQDFIGYQSIIPDYMAFSNFKEYPQGNITIDNVSDNVIYDNSSRQIMLQRVLGTDTEIKHLKTKKRSFLFQGKIYQAKFNVGFDVDSNLKNVVLEIINSINKGYSGQVFLGTSTNTGYYTNSNNLDLGTLTFSSISELSQTIKQMIRRVAENSSVSESDVKILISGDDLVSYLAGTENDGTRTNQAVLYEQFGADTFYELKNSTIPVNSLSAYADPMVVRHTQLDPALYNLGDNQEDSYTWHIFRSGSTAIDIKVEGAALTYSEVNPPALREAVVDKSSGGIKGAIERFNTSKAKNKASKKSK